ncbi:MAG: NADH-quinone oxidoreductase subunit C [Candidatus Nanopelagicales bacterium]|nr:NADH-quinone oxidoreductase subunit C [Candidatus Nanopelagicales bacterium]
MREVDQVFWADEFRALQSQGYFFFDFLTAYERDSQLVVIARVANPETKQSQMLTAKVDAQQNSMASISVTYPGAIWHERETTEMFGISFVGLEDARPLLRRSMLGRPPLLKSSVLAARMLKPWPGQPSHRKQQPVGVVDDWLQL